jgi:uncharacterized protein (TIGR00725 family)
MAAKKIAVIGSYSVDSKKVSDLASELGVAIAEGGFSVLIGIPCGCPSEVATAAKNAGAQIYGIFCGYSSAVDFPPKESNALCTQITYVNLNQIDKGRVLVSEADAVIVINGGEGTAQEFLDAEKMGKLIGVLEGSGGISDYLRSELRSSKKQPANVFLSSDPVELVKLIRRELDARNTENRTSKTKLKAPR